ncbi:hypothetical protein [Nonomuraea jiangxiensis]|uniref:hypothetical protein n=1 Tax=Nonomuraea jiangxiensis TaxID=633440 RepID=UPI00115FC509|nr:hypothetical protein [Nonomuraea jiangxiensis]
MRSAGINVTDLPRTHGTACHTGVPGLGGRPTAAYPLGGPANSAAHIEPPPPALDPGPVRE